MTKINLPPKKCPVCSTEFDRYSCRQLSDFKEKIYCSRDCYYKGNSGDNHYNYKNGIRTRKDGYQRNSKDQYIHRLVMEAHIGRKLKRSEHVHHKNEDPSDNRLDNLVLIGNTDHSRLHANLRKRDDKGRWL